MPAYSVHVQGQSIFFNDQILLLDALRIGGVSHTMPCGGQGTCGKCAVWVQGIVEEPGKDEKILLAKYAFMQPPSEGYTLRLACYCVLVSDGTIVLPDFSYHIVTESTGTLPFYDGNDMGTLGFAVDIGTTTIAMRLYDMQSGALLFSHAAMNQQSLYGADVLSRIMYANEHGISVLQDMLVKQLTDMMRVSLENASVQASQVERIVVVGNATMLHFLRGLDPRGIGVAPFTPQSLFGETIPAHCVFPMFDGIAFDYSSSLYIPPCVSAYVGADITSGMLATGFDDIDGTFTDLKSTSRLLVDVGTNGEMAMQMNGKLICCATAAGPAFEGAQIEMGMPAVHGAIYSVSMKNGEIGYQTIGNATPLGICGTGMISALAALLTAGVVDETGLLLSNGHAFHDFVIEQNGKLVFRIGDSGVVITSQDIRQMQLAKAAIAAGIDTLLQTEKTVAEHITELLLAGGFGSQLQPLEAARIGLIPEAFASNTRAVGNAALQGASMMLFSIAHRRKSERLARCAQETSLSSSALFMERYIENMMFPER